MRVSDLKNILADLQDDEDICVLLWTNQWADDPDYTLTTEQWAEVVRQFDDGVPDEYISEWLMDTVTEVSFSEEDA
jgi:hypothetical protein